MGSVERGEFGRAELTDCSWVEGVDGKSQKLNFVILVQRVHIKMFKQYVWLSSPLTGTWQPINTVCESDTLCDPAAVLVSTTNPEPHIRNRRLSPGSGNCGGGGGGGCLSGNDQLPRQLSPQGDLIGPGHTASLSFRREKERKGQQHKGRSLRRESQKGVSRVGERPQKAELKQRWVEDSLSLLKPPPAFPVQDSPAKLQPAVSYASKVKAGSGSGALEEDRPAIGMLLQNQWGLSFISEARPVTEASSTSPTGSVLPPQHTDADQSTDNTVLTVQSPEETPIPVSTSVNPTAHPEEDESNGKLLLSCRHLVEAFNYHNRGESQQTLKAPFLTR